MSPATVQPPAPFSVKARINIQFHPRERITLTEEGSSREIAFPTLSAALRFAESFGPAGCVLISMLDRRGRMFGQATI
jgi:hypothetical protein